MDALPHDTTRTKNARGALVYDSQPLSGEKSTSGTPQRKKPSQRRTALSPKIVELRLELAALTLRNLRVPGVWPDGMGSNWPDVIHQSNEAYGYSKAEVRTPQPTAEQIAAMDEALAWLRLLEPEEARLVWMKANQKPWKIIMRETGKSRTTLWTQWSRSIAQIVTHLNVVAEKVIADGSQA